ncbi:helix-turn-helix domain-containing protein [Halarsenatibacter silvermanii]|uniref:Helix-turn-helix n=1 Tax=Halarsenatibacter silvermanii TaxID=321763 RepID=A0A1G9S987_9FIRM|nr:helix-turn-helix transcriptional regulator [Halarsenatibacter silvermanii]SDM31931.1 Helix-turn-helix [Halarsenatibacter silvermanii]
MSQNENGDKNTDNFLASLKSLRKIYNLSQKEMAEKLYMSESSYCRKENGKSQFTQSDIEIITKIFECPYHIMVKGIKNCLNRQ